MTWDDKFMGLARHIATWSKDRSTKVGAVIVGPDREVRSLGYNGIPRDVIDDVEDRHKRPMKYMWTEHAERNAVYNAARHGTPLHGCIMYVTARPCCDCMRAIIQCGICRVVYGDELPVWWQTNSRVGKTMADEAGVEMTKYDA